MLIYANEKLNFKKKCMNEWIFIHLHADFLVPHIRKAQQDSCFPLCAEKLLSQPIRRAGWLRARYCANPLCKQFVQTILLMFSDNCLRGQTINKVLQERRGLGGFQTPDSQDKSHVCFGQRGIPLVKWPGCMNIMEYSDRIVNCNTNKNRA